VFLEVFARIQELEEQEAEAAKQAMIEQYASELFNSQAPRIGSPNGDYVAVEFFDYSCGFCKQALGEVDRALDGRDDITVVLKEFPILGAASELAARVGMALRQSEGDEAYVSYHRALMLHPERLDEDLVESVIDELGFDFGALKEHGQNPDISAELRANRQLGVALGINGTPAFVFRNDIVAGLIRADAFVEKIEQAAQRVE
jgi:protein-disulfide isomerase